MATSTKQISDGGGDAINPMGTDGFEFIEYTAPDPSSSLSGLAECLSRV